VLVEHRCVFAHLSAKQVQFAGLHHAARGREQRGADLRADAAAALAAAFSAAVKGAERE
ncbi:unnamed protein product, partial [Effrenium voratum]